MDGIVQCFKLIVRTRVNTAAIIQIILSSIDHSTLSAVHDFSYIAHLAG